MTTEAQLLAERAARVPELNAPRLLSPHMTEAANMALEFVADCCHPEAYGHALPAEMVKRAGRILAMVRPKPQACAVPGYGEPPPARCEWCDSE